MNSQPSQRVVRFGTGKLIRLPPRLRRQLAQKPERRLCEACFRLEVGQSPTNESKCLHLPSVASTKLCLGMAESRQAAASRAASP